MHGIDRVANLLGASALTLIDLAVSEATRKADLTASQAAALVSLAATDGLTVTELGRRVGLTQPAASRLVDSLEVSGLTERRPNPYGGRWRIVHVTAAGRDVAHGLLTARKRPLADAVSVLDEDEQRALADLLAKILARLYHRAGHAQRICRLCDRAACDTDEEVCPVGEAERIHGRAIADGR